MRIEINERHIQNRWSLILNIGNDVIFIMLLIKQRMKIFRKMVAYFSTGDKSSFQINWFANLESSILLSWASFFSEEFTGNLNTFFKLHFSPF